MKRTFWFGMIWTLAVAPVILYEIFVYLVVGIPRNSRYVIALPSYERFSFLAKPSVECFFSYARIIVPAIFAAVVFWLFWRKGYITWDRLKFWKSLNAHASTRHSGWRGLSVRIAVVVMTILGGVLFYIKVPVLNPGSVLLIVSSYEQYAPYSIIAFLLALRSNLLPIMFSVATFSYAVSTCDTKKDFYSKASLSVVGLFCIGLFYGGLYYAQGVLDLDKTLDKLPGLSFEKQQRSLLVLTRPDDCLPLADLYHDYDSPQEMDVLPYNDNNWNVIEDFISRRAGKSGLTDTAYNYLIRSRVRLLDIQGANALRFKAFETTGSMLEGGLLNGNLGASPAPEKNRSVIDSFSDDARFSIRGSSAFRFAKLYARLGDQDKAEYWYKKGISTGEDVTDDDKEEYDPQKPQTFYGCIVSGKLTFEGKPWNGERVGIVRSAKLIMLKEEVSSEALFNTIMQNYTDGTTTDASGRFTFDHLGEEEYVLLLSVDTSGGKKYRVLNSPGPLKVSEKNPAADAGTINVVME